MSDQPIFDEFGNLIEDVEDIENIDEQQDYDDDEEERVARDEQQNGHTTAADGDGDEPMVQEEEEDSHVEFKTRQPGNAIVLHEDKQYYPDASEVYGQDVEVMVQDEDTQPISKPVIDPGSKRSFLVADKELPDTSFSKEFLVDMMAHPQLMRNVCLVGNLHSGKSKFMDMLVNQTHERKWTHAKASRYTDTRNDEQERGMSIKSAPMSLILPNSNDKSYLVNVLDTPGHVNFTDEVLASLRLCDAAIVVVDALEGVMMQTERLIKLAVQEGLAIAVVINKVDRLILELKLPPQDAYFKLKHTIDEINSILDLCSHGQPTKLRVSPELGNVLFASAEMGWCFSLFSFAKIYQQTFGGFAPAEFAKRLWGDLYFHPDVRGFRRKPSPQVTDSQRSFVQYILNPLYKIYSTVLAEDKSKVEKVLLELGIRLSRETLNLDVKPLLRIVLSSFFGKATGFVDMVVDLPSPLDNAEQKASFVYTGPLNGTYGEALKKCDPNGPLVVYVTKLLTNDAGTGFDCLGRVLSGTVRRSSEVRVLGERYSIDTNEEDLVLEELTKVSIGEARYKIDVDSIPAGMWCLLEGIDSSIIKTATIVNERDPKMTNYTNGNSNGNSNGNGDYQDDYGNVAHICRPLSFATSPSVCKVAIEPLNPSELPKMLDGLRKINKSYPQVVTRAEESGEHIILGTGELYLDCVLHDLRVMYADIEIKVDDPVITLSETATETSSIPCMSESQNHRNRLTMVCEPLEKGLADDIESGKVDISWPRKQRTEFFQNKYDWDVLAANNIWAFGPDAHGPNILINDTIGGDVNRSHLTAISESVVRGFQWATKEGPLVDEPIRNVKFKLVGAHIAPEAIHRTSGHIVPAARSSTHASLLVAAPRLMEPVYMVEIISPPDCVSSIETVFHRRRGNIIHDFPKPGTPLHVTKGLLPVLDSYGFETDLRSHTQGLAFCLSVFDHYQIVPGDPLDKDVQLLPLEPSPQQHLARELLIKTRRRKGLSEDVNLSKHFNDEQLLNLMSHMSTN